MRRDGYFHIGGAAKQIGVHKNTLRRWIKEGKLDQLIGNVKKDIRGWKIFSQEDIVKIRTHVYTIKS